MSLVARIINYLEDHPDAGPDEIAEAIGERVQRVASGLPKPKKVKRK